MRAIRHNKVDRPLGLKIDLGFHQIDRPIEAEANFFTNSLHGSVFWQNFSGDALKLLVPAYLQQPPQHFSSQSLSLKGIADHEGELSFIHPMRFAQPTDSQDFVFASSGMFVICHQRHLAIVVDEAQPHQPFVGDPLAQFN